MPDGDFPILVHEIRNRLQVLVDIGLGYLTLGRSANTLSGGESQRISIATSLGSSLVGSLYILDEPSIGLHSRDTQQLIGVLRRLQQLGNTVVVVEHDEEIMRAADHIIDLGPDAGVNGGQIVFQGEVKDIKPQTSDTRLQNSTSHTIRFLMGKEQIAVPQSRRSCNRYIEVKGARANNLKGIDVKFPLNIMTVVTGVSGSGKSTLVNNILYRGLKRHLDEACDRPGEFLSLEGNLKAVKAVTLVDQSSIGTSSRSNPITYIKAYDLIRRLMADHKRFKQHREFRERLDDDPEERMRDRREERRNAFSRRGGEDDDRRSRFADRGERPARRPSSRNPFAPHAEEGERGGRNEWREERREGRNEGFREKRGFKGGKDFGHKNYGKGGGRKDFGRGNKGRTYGDEED